MLQQLVQSIEGDTPQGDLCLPLPLQRAREENFVEVCTVLYLCSGEVPETAAAENAQKPVKLLIVTTQISCSIPTVATHLTCLQDSCASCLAMYAQ